MEQQDRYTPAGNPDGGKGWVVVDLQANEGRRTCPVFWGKTVEGKPVTTPFKTLGAAMTRANKLNARKH